MDRPLDDFQEAEAIPHEKWYGMLALALAIEPFIYLLNYVIVKYLYGNDLGYYDSFAYKMVQLVILTGFRMVPVLMALKLRSGAIKVVVIVLVSIFWLLDVLRSFDLFNIYD